jgi:hypothetical protein
MMIRDNIGRKTSRNKGYVMIMKKRRRRNSMRSGKKNWCSVRISWRSGCIEGVSTP